MAQHITEGDYFSEAQLGNNASTGPMATPEEFGARVGEAMAGLGQKIQQGGATVADIGEMQAHMKAQQYVSNTMAQHRNTVAKFMADPKNYTDPNYAQNLKGVLDGAMPDMQKNAPNLLARNQVSIEANDFHASSLDSAYKTQTDVLMQKGFNDHVVVANTNLDTYRTDLTNPNVDAGNNLYQSFDKQMTAITNQYHQIAPQMERELKDQLTTQYAYGAVNTNPDLAEKLLNRGYIEGRTRHFLEDAIQSARGAQEIGARQDATDATSGLLEKATMFPDQVVKGFPPAYYETHGWKPKEAAEMSAKVQSQLDVNKDFATIRDSVTGSDEQTLLKKQGDMYEALKTLDPASDKFNHDAQVLDRMQKFTQESITKLHDDPVNYLTSYNKEISSATQAYHDDPSPQRFQTMVGLVKQYQGAPPTGDTSGKYLNLAPHEMHILDKQQAEDIGKQLMGMPQSQVGDYLHNTILSKYNPDDQSMVLNDLVNVGKIPLSAYAMERTYGSPHSQEIASAFLNSDVLRKTIGVQMADGKTKNMEAIDKMLATNNDWQNWSKTAAGDNFQRADIVPGFESLIKDYALAQMGKPGGTQSPKDAVQTAYNDLIAWDHKQVAVNGRVIDMKSDKYPGTAAEASRAMSDAINHLDISQLDFRKTFHATMEVGHTAARDEAMRSMLQTKVFPHQIDENTFSLYERGQGNDFVLRDKSGKPIIMDYRDLPTYSFARDPKPGAIGRGMQATSHEVTNWPVRQSAQSQDDAVKKYQQDHPEIQ